LRIDQPKMSDAHMRQLLGDVRTAAAKSDDGDARVG
jgi:hypothetical protein